MSLWNKNAFKINAILVSLTKKQLLLFVLLSVFSTKVFGAGWNTVWQEDFGVVEDSVCRDFADPNMSVPGHLVADTYYLDDGYYGITNSTYWAFIHKSYLNLSEAYHFVPGRDHTGNEKGGMLVVNVGTNGTGEVIYENYLNLKMCGNHKYRLSMYVANVSDAPISPHLTLNVYNIKDPQNPELLKSVELLEEDVVKWPGSEKNTQGLYIFKEREWTESSLEFVAKDNDVLKIVINNYNSRGNGNDFAIDDIVLERYDDEEIIQPVIESDNNMSKINCKPTYVIRNNSLLNSWKSLYDNVYFLWQYSLDDGYTWNTLLDESGIEKTELLRDQPKVGHEVYRLIITGGATDTEAQSKAEYIAQNGTPTDGCDYFSISNIISQAPNKKVYTAIASIDYDNSKTIQPKYDCEAEEHYVFLGENEWDLYFPSYSFLWQYSNDESTWTDLSITSNDFLFTDDFEGLTYFRAILASDDNILKQVKQNGKPDNCYDDYFITNSVALECSTSCKKPEYEAVQDKLIICEDNNSPIEWQVTQTNTAKVETNEWYKKEAGETDWTLIAGETRENLSVTNPKASTSYLFLAKYRMCVSDSIFFELTVNPSITVANLDDVEICEGSDAEFSAKTVTGNPTQYIWNNELLSKNLFKLSNILIDKTVTLSATDGVCTSPEVSALIKVEKKADVTLQQIPNAVCEGTTIDLVANAQLSASNTFKWEKNGNVITDADLSTSDIADVDATYKFTVLGNKCNPIEKELTIAVEKEATVSLDQTPNAVCEGTTIDLVANAQLSAANTFKWEKNGNVITDANLSTSDIADVDATYKFTVLANKCNPIEKELSVTVEKKVDVTLAEIPSSICEGNYVDLVADATLAPSNTIKWEKNGVLLTDTKLSVKDNPSVDVTYKFTIDGEYCPPIEKELKTKVEKKADVTLKPLPTVVCEGTSVDLIADVKLEAINSFKWEKENSLISDADLVTSDIPDKDAKYKFVVYGEACPEIKKEVSVKVEKSAKLDLSIDKSDVCEDTEVTLSVNAQNAPALVWMQKIEGESEFSELSETGNKLQITAQRPTVFKVASKNEQVCRSVVSNEVSLSMNESAVPHILGHEEVMDKMYQMIVDNNDETLYYDYHNGEGKTTSSLLKNAIIGKVYNVEVSNEIGCSSTYRFEIPFIEPEFPPYFYQGEENWQVGNLEYYTYSTLFIYDRFGKLLYTENSATEGWDGVYKGYDLPSTDYWYVLDIPAIDKRYTGHFALMRR